MVYIRSILKSKSYTDLYRLCVRTPWALPWMLDWEPRKEAAFYSKKVDLAWMVL